MSAPPVRPKDRRQLIVLLLGVILVFSFLLPIELAIRPGTGPYPSSPQRLAEAHVVRFSSIDALSDASVPNELKLMIACPGVAGLLLVLYTFLDARPRGVAILVLWVLAAVSWGMLPGALDFLFPAAAEIGLWSAFPAFAILATIASGAILFAAATSRWLQPADRIAWRFGAVGGILEFISLLCAFVLICVPANGIKEFGELMADDAIAWASLILANLCGIACAVLCLVNRPDTSLSKSRQRAGAAAVLMAASWVFGGVLSITVLAAHMPPLIVDNLAPLAIKVGVPFCGLALLLPLALVELIVGDRGYADLKSERATQKKYPVIPWT